MHNGGTIASLVAHHEWKFIPLLVGGKDGKPKFKDLIEFEELDDYSLISQDTSTPLKLPKTVEKSRKKQSRIKRRKALKRKLAADSKSANVQSDQPTSEQPNTSVILPHKKQKLVGNSSADVECESVGNECDVSAWEPLYVCEAIRKSLSELGFSTPMPIQEQILPAAIRDRRDVFGAAETGSGKTLAFGIPLLHHLIDDKERNLTAITGSRDEDLSPLMEEDLDSDFENDGLDTEESKSHIQSEIKLTEKVLPALILTPTRELAMQVKNHISKIAKYTGLWLVAVVGGMSSQKQVRLLNKQPDIVIATPGRLHELMDSGHPYLAHLHKLRYLVIDEADRMLERGHFEDLSKLLDVINSGSASRKRQTYVFSATLTTIHQGPARKSVKTTENLPSKKIKLEKLTKKLGMRAKPHIVDLTTAKVTAETLSEAKILCEVDEKDFYLYYFLKSYPGRTLIFTNSIDCIFRLSGILDVLGCQPQHIHAKMQQRQRLKHLERFRANQNAIMIASDVAARGLDIPDVKHVIHYQVPRTMETYIHRSGRSARSGKDGLSLMFVSPSEMHFYKRVCHSLKKSDGLALFQVDQNYMASVKKRVNIARDVDKLSHKIKKVNLHNDWFKKAAKEMEMELDEDILVKNDDDGETERMIASKKQQLTALLKKPIFPRGFSGKFITQRGELLQPGFKANGLAGSDKTKKSKRKRKR